MFNSVVAVISIVAFVLPGFVVTQIASSKRSPRIGPSDWELVLRALFFSVLIHVAFAPWTRLLVHRLEGDATAWEEHLGAVMLYGTVVLLASPLLLGYLLNRILRRLEKRSLGRGDDLSGWSRALGARDPQHAWDFLFERTSSQGAFLLVRMTGGVVLAGKYSEGSYVSQTVPDKHGDLYLEELWTVSTEGELDQRIEPTRGTWLAADAIEAVQVLPFKPTTGDVVAVLVGHQSPAKRRAAAEGLGRLWVGTDLEYRASAAAVAVAATNLEHARKRVNEVSGRPDSTIDAIEAVTQTLRRREEASQETLARFRAAEIAQDEVRRAIDPLARALRDQNRSVRLAAIEALAAFGDEARHRLGDIDQIAKAEGANVRTRLAMRSLRKRLG
jgi:hypothetical protein